ncbi:MAG: ATP12 family chaperone protein, partial [Cypionkella sp.]
DGRGVKTPAKNPLIVPTAALAQMIAAEWDAQTGLVRPETMPMTRRANSALEKVAPQMQGVIDELAGYGASDLLCYHAEAPQELAQRQAAAWQPWLDWAARFDAFGLAGLHDLVSISGSLVLALAMAKGALTPDAGFALSRIDETWQAQHWGRDEQAAALESSKHAALLDAAAFLAATF